MDPAVVASETSALKYVAATVKRVLRQLIVSTFSASAAGICGVLLGGLFLYVIPALGWRWGGAGVKRQVTPTWGLL